MDKLAIAISLLSLVVAVASGLINYWHAEYLSKLTEASKSLDALEHRLSVLSSLRDETVPEEIGSNPNEHI